ncbi:MAG: translocation/assembly module TamB domain-containing protein [Gammaproteobacteria bacterium]
MRRRRLIAALVSVTLLAAAGGAAGYLLNSERGLRWAFALAARAIPGELRAAQLHGRLLGPIEAKALVSAGPGAKVTVARASLDWRPGALFAGRVHITHVHLTDVVVTQKQSRRAAPPRTLPSPTLTPPLAVSLDDLRVEHLRVQRLGAAPLTVGRIDLQATADAKRIRIATFRVAADTWWVALDGHVAPRTPYRTQLHTQWRLQPPGRAALEGSGQITGNVRNLQIRQTLAKPFRAELHAGLTDLLKTPRWQGRVQFDAAKLRDLVPGARAVTLSGEARGKGTFARFDANADVKAHDAELGEVDAALEVRRNADRWLLDRLEASVPGTPTRLSARGHLDRAAGNGFDLQAQWHALRWPLRGQAQVESEQGNASVEGTLARYRLTLDTQLNAADTALGRWQAEGDGDTRSLRLTSLKGDPLGGRIQGQGQIAWQPTPSWSAHLTGRGLDPAHRWKDWPGRIDFALEHSGRVTNGKLDTDTRLTRLEGRLRGQPLTAALALHTQGPDLELSRAEITHGKAHLSATGNVSRTWALRWSLKAPDLAAVLPDAQGALNADGQLSGPRERPALAVRLNADKLAWRDYGAAQAKVEGALDLSDTRPSDLHVDVTHLQLPERSIDAVNIEATGRAARHRITIAAHTGEAKLQIAIDGALAQEHWRGRLTRLTFDSRPFGQWTLAQAGDITVSRAGIDLAQSCLTAAPARLCVQGGWQRGGNWQGTVQAKRLPLAMVDPWLPPGVYLTGVADATARLAASAQARQADLELNLPAGSLLYAPNGGELQAAPYQDGRLTITTTDGALHGRAQLDLGQSGRLRGELRLPRFADTKTALADQPVDAPIEAKQVGLQWLPAAFPELARASGELQGRIAIGATLGSPTLNGALSVDGASVEIPRLGLHLSGIALAVRNSGSDRLAFEGRATSGEGTLKLRGYADTNVLQGGGAALTLEGEKITVADIPEAKIVASPKLALRVDDYQAHLTGEVRVPKATLEPGKYKPPVSASPDVVIIGAEQSREPLTRWRLHTRVNLILGDAVTFQGYGLTGKLGGGLVAIDEPGQATVGEGEIRVTEGKYKIYGRELIVEQGRLLFPGGPITNPNVDARAVRKIGDVTVGVRVQGPLKAPQVSLFSDPSMDQGDILSYLVVGRPLNAASKSEGNLVYAAATSLGLQGGGLMVKRIGTMFGIQDVQITEQTSTQSGTQQPALLLGTYLSPRLYVADTVGLFEPSQVLQFRFQLTPHWEVRTESGSAASGADLLYSIER